MEKILEELVEQYRDEIVETTKKLVALPSLYEEGNETYPFGEPIGKALEKVLEISEEMGFETCIHDGYVGTVKWGNEGKQIGIMTRIDVVPPGEGWTYPPFEGTIENGRLYGRGSLDDKGPMAASLFAMKAIKESGLPVKNHVCHIIGTDEESGFMRCLKNYLEKEPAPWGGFSPDGEFPVIHAEKGILRFYVTDRWENTNDDDGLILVEVGGGTKVNVVPAFASALVRGGEDAQGVLEQCRDAFADKDKISFEPEDGGWRVKAKGMSGHSSQPWNGDNAINTLLRYLLSLPLRENGQMLFASKIAGLFGDGYRGERLGVACEDQLSGILTLSLGVLKIGSEDGKATVEIRYPIHASDEIIQKTLMVACQDSGVDIEIIQDKKHIYYPVKAPLVQELLKVYQETTGRTEAPVVIGGGTYCRAVDNFVAYGPVFPGQRELAHEPDEYIGVEDLILTAKIYAQALYALLNM